MGKFNYLLQNIATAIYTIFNRRDKKTIIVGAWMGSKFADNSRYLYQYLYKNKKELGLNNVIWVTRNRDVNVMLNNSGYKSCLIGTKESKYWHLKAGCHVLCNMAFPYPNYDTDFS